MNATKRKFNALLNGIGSKSTTSTTSPDVNNANTMNRNAIDSFPKKRRIGDTVVTLRRVPPKGSERTPTLPTKQNNGASVQRPATSTDTPKYAPWDRAKFLARLKTFSNLTDWTPKPARVNEVEWAKRGWACQGSERVRCCVCNVEILVKLNKKEVDGKEEDVYVAANIENALVDRYAELIITSHAENCLWRQRGCDDSIFKLPLNHAPTTIKNLRERYNELLTRSETLPYYFNLRTPPGFDLDSVVRYLPTEFFTSPTTTEQHDNASPQVDRVAFMMALFGWQGHLHERLGNQPGSVSCHACFRVLGLWIFKSKKVSETGEELAGAIVDRLEVTKEHREYCPWQNPASQNGRNPSVKTSTSSMAGWEIAVRILKNDHHLRSTKDVQPRKRLSLDGMEQDEEVDNDDARSVRDEKDKERWARLRRVKSLFETKAGKRLSRSNTTSKPADI